MNSIDNLAQAVSQEKENKKKKTLEERYNESVEKTQYYTAVITNWFFKYLSEVLMIGFAFFLIGAQQFAEAEFNPTFFLNAQFWYEYIPYVLGQWLVLISALTGKFKNLMDSDKLYIDLKNQIQDHVDDDTKEAYIDKVANKEDRERKIRKFVQITSNKLRKKMTKYHISNFKILEVFLGIKTEDEMRKEFNDEIKADKNVLLLRAIKVSRRMEKAVRNELYALYERLSDDYIEENIDNIKLKYNRVTYSILTNGFSPSTNYNEDTDFRPHVSKTVWHEFGISQLVLMLVFFALLTMQLTEKEVTFISWIFFIMKTMVILWNYFQGTFRAPQIFTNTHVRTHRERLQILNKGKLSIAKKVVEETNDKNE